jgi:hypothetical protein
VFNDRGGSLPICFCGLKMMKQNDIAKQLERCEAKLVQFVLTQDQEYENQKEEITRLKARNAKLERVRDAAMIACHYPFDGINKELLEKTLKDCDEAARSGE